MNARMGHESLATPQNLSSQGDDLEAITELLWSFVPYHALRVAIETGLFDVIAELPHASVESIATRMGWKVRPTERLLAVLAGLALIERSDDSAYTNLAKVRRYFLRSSGQYLGSYTERLRLLEAAYQNLESHLKTDFPDPALNEQTKRAFGLSPNATANDVAGFGEVLEATSKSVALQFAKVARINNEARILDIGAGSAVFARCLIENGHQGLVDILDTPLVCEHASQKLRSAHPQITCIPGDWNKWQPSKKYDAVFLHHTLHEERLPEAEKLLDRAVRSLDAAGSVYVLGIFELPGRPSRLARFFGLNLLLENGGDNTSLNWLREQAKRHGLVEQQVAGLPGGRSFWVGRRQ